MARGDRRHRAAPIGRAFEVVLRHGHVGSIVDLDRSNSLPDVVSTVVLAAAAAAAILLAGVEMGTTPLTTALAARWRS